MKLAALPLVALFAFGCATAGQPPAGARNDCGARMGPLTLRSGTEVRNAPESGAVVKTTLTASTPVCASTEGPVFGFRRVKLPDGTIGFVNESGL
jgi:hypothetical protein